VNVRTIAIGSLAAVTVVVTLAHRDRRPSQPSEQERLPAKLSGEFTPLAPPDIAKGPCLRD
jgi:hypothetical protein